MHWVARESLWFVASCLVAAGLLFANGGSWSVNHGLAQRAPVMTLRFEAATCALLYGASWVGRAMARVFRN
jgi:hypothetical protein